MYYDNSPPESFEDLLTGIDRLDFDDEAYREDAYDRDDMSDSLDEFYEEIGGEG